MTRQLKVFTLGIHGFIRAEVNTALGLAPHIRQARVLAVATTKAHAMQVYGEHGFPIVTQSDSEFRLTSGNDINALTEAGLLTEPSVWVLPSNFGGSRAVVRMQPGGEPQRVGHLEDEGRRLVYVPEQGVTAVPASRPATVEQYAAQELRRQVEGVAARLADLTARVSSYAEAVELTGDLGRPYYANVARDVVHEVNTTLMNLNLGGLSTTAATADIARAKGE